MAGTFIKNKNMVFLHVPKTSGTSMHKWLSDNVDCYPHLPEDFANEHLPLHLFKEKFNINSDPDYFFICRNPYDWVYSYYRHNTRNINKRIKKTTEKMSRREIKYYKEVHYSSFEYWLSNLSEDSPLYERFDQGVVSKQTKFIDRNKPPAFLVRFENIEQETERLAKLFGITQPYPRINTSGLTQRKGPDMWKQAYTTNAMKQKVQKMFSHDFEYFGYSKDF